jgi:ferredoxin/flavodoxin---NADP+ reductase
VRHRKLLQSLARPIICNGRDAAAEWRAASVMQRQSIMSAYTVETVLSVRHWTDTLFSFTATRSPAFRYDNGQFVMMGLEADGRPLLRAYSLVSTNYDDSLEFLSIKVPDGPLTSRLQHIREADRILVGRKPTGSLLVHNLLPGRALYLLGTGTGLAPFMSIIRDPETYERFEKVVLVHGCRQVAELAYGERITEELPNDELVGDLVRGQLTYYPTVTREPYRNRGRITDLITSGQLSRDVDLPPLDAEADRMMLCGSPQMLADMRAVLDVRGFREGSSSEPGSFVVEKAFVER